MTMYDNVVTTSSSCIHIGTPCVIQSVYKNHFFRDEASGGYFVSTNEYSGSERYLDFSNNYWGTFGHFLIS